MLKIHKGDSIWDCEGAAWKTKLHESAPALTHLPLLRTNSNHALKNLTFSDLDLGPVTLTFDLVFW